MNKKIFLQIHFLILLIIVIVRNDKAHFGLPEYPLYKLFVLRYIDTVFLKKKQNELSGFV